MNISQQQPSRHASQSNHLPDGREFSVWEGTEPAGTAPINKVFKASGNLWTKSIVIYLDTSRVPGWNEIDAVEIVGQDGSRQWASQATASSSYADRQASGRLQFSGEIETLRSNDWERFGDALR